MKKLSSSWKFTIFIILMVILSLGLQYGVNYYLSIGKVVEKKYYPKKWVITREIGYDGVRQTAVEVPEFQPEEYEIVVKFKSGVKYRMRVSKEVFDKIKIGDRRRIGVSL